MCGSQSLVHFQPAGIFALLSHPGPPSRLPSERQTQVSIIFLVLSGACSPRTVLLSIFRVLLLLPCTRCPLLPGWHPGHGGRAPARWPGDVPSRVSCLWKESVWWLGFSLSLLGFFPLSLPKDEVIVLLFCLLWCLSQSSKAALRSTAEIRLRPGLPKGNRQVWPVFILATLKRRCSC